MASLQKKTARCLPAKQNSKQTKDQSMEFQQFGSDVIPCLAEPVKWTISIHKGRAWNVV